MKVIQNDTLSQIGNSIVNCYLVPPGPNLLRLPRDGERVGSLEAIATPGHTDDSLSFLDIRNHYLIVGDAMQTAGGVAVAGKIQLLFPFPGLTTQNKREAVKSAEKLLKRSPSLLAPGHGAMLANPQKAIRSAIIEAQRSLK